MSKYGMGLVKGALLGRSQLIGFALLSAIANGIVTALIGGWLAQSYAAHQKKTAAIQTIADLVYERRTRAGMVVWAIKRKAEPDELRYRKRAYDEAFVAWNKNVQHNIFKIRDISGQSGVTRLETQFQDLLVPAMAETDRCLTKAYDARLTGTDAMPILDACQMPDLHQFTLDCGATFTNELDRLTRLTFLPWNTVSDTQRKAAEARIDKGCTRAVPTAASLSVSPAPGTAAIPGPTIPGPTATGTPAASLTANPAQPASPAQTASPAPSGSDAVAGPKP